MRGSLLVSSPDMEEPTFARTVIYLVEHNEDGTFGVILNRRSEAAVHNVLPAWAGLCAAPPALFVGGPVRPENGVCLAVVRPGADTSGIEGLQLIEGRVHVVDMDTGPDAIAEVIEGVRIFVGYAGWGAGQLDEELNRGDWFVAPALASDILPPARVDLYGEVLRRQEMPLPLYATHPVDPMMN